MQKLKKVAFIMVFFGILTHFALSSINISHPIASATYTICSDNDDDSSRTQNYIADF